MRVSKRLSPKKKFNPIKFLIILVLLVAIVCGGGYCWYTNSIKSVSQNDELVKIMIPLGTGTSGIANILKDNNLIKSKLAFKNDPKQV